MITTPIRSLVPAVSAALVLACLPAHAQPLCDSFAPGDQYGPSAGLGWNSNFDQRLGVLFTVEETTTITDFLVAINGLGSFRMGVQGGVTTAQGFVPSSSFLFDVLVNDPTANYAQGGLSWTLDPGDYFFVAQGDAFGTNGGWGRGVGGQTVLNGAQAGWFYPGVPAMALRLNSVDGEVPAIPEPSTYALLIGGGVFLALVRRRRTGPQAS